MVKQEKINMTEGSLFRNMVAYTIPIILINLWQTLYNAADVIVVGNFAGKEALGAVGATSAISNLILCVFISITVGTSVVMGRSFGAQDRKESEKIVHTSIAVSLIIGFLMLFVGVFFAKTLLILMGTPDDLLVGATLYMQITFLGMPAVLFYNFGAAALRATGDTKNPLKFMSVSGIINVVLNVILVVFFHMDVAGVAIATIVSQYVSAAMLYRLMKKTDGFCRIEINKLKIDKKVLFEILRLGVPAAIQSLVCSFANVLVQTAINSFNNVSVSAGDSVTSNVLNFIYIAQNALSVTVVTAVSQHVGAKKYDGINRCVIYSVIMAVVVGLGVTGIIYINPRWFISIYNSDPAVVDVALIKLSFACVPFFICGIAEVLMGAQRGLGMSVVPMCIAIGCEVGVRILWIVFVFNHFHTLEILFAAYPVLWIASAVMCAIAYVICKKRIVKKLIAENA